MHRVKLYHLRQNVKFIVMNSVFDTDKTLQIFFDLKGSTIGRNSKPGQDVKKDNDLRKSLIDSAFALSEDMRKKMRSQLLKDCNFMKKMKIMDYSMLVGVHHIPSKSIYGRNLSVLGGLTFRDSVSLRKQKDVNFVLKRSISTLNALKLKRLSEDSVISKSTSSHTSHFIPDSSSSFSPQVVSNYEWKRTRGDLGEDFENDALFFLSPDFIDDKIYTECDHDRSIASNSTVDQVLEDEDDDSYLDMTKIQYPILEHTDSGSERDDYSVKKKKITEIGKDRVSEEIYWPFHRFYEVHGRRRMAPLMLPNESDMEIDVDKAEKIEKNLLKDCSVECFSCLRDTNDFTIDIVKPPDKWLLPAFETPISNRKDGGLEMDVNEVKLPLLYNTQGKKQLIDGKIFYMGIIDVLQQFNVRKRIEARYRQLKGGGWEGASCVHPTLYAERFIRFFDEYSKGTIPNYVNKMNESNHQE